MQLTIDIDDMTFDSLMIHRLKEDYKIVLEFYYRDVTRGVASEDYVYHLNLKNAYESVLKYYLTESAASEFIASVNS